MEKTFQIKVLPVSWADPVLSASAASNLLAQPHHLLLATTQDAEEAYVFASLMPGAPADILTLYTHPNQRRRGHARLLLNTLIQKAKMAGCPSLTLEVRAGNTAARALYESLQFQQLATRPGYYQNPREDAVVYSLNLG